MGQWGTPASLVAQSWALERGPAGWGALVLISRLGFLSVCNPFSVPRTRNKVPLLSDETLLPSEFASPRTKDLLCAAASVSSGFSEGGGRTWVPIF